MRFLLQCMSRQLARLCHSPQRSDASAVGGEPDARLTQARSLRSLRRAKLLGRRANPLEAPGHYRKPVAFLAAVEQRDQAILISGP